MDAFERYFDKLKHKRVLVLGMGVSNRPLIRLLLARGIAVIGCDKTPREALDPEILEMEAQGLRLHVGEDYLNGLAGDVAFRTPGLHPDRPELAALRAAGTVLTSEMEAFFELCPCPIIGITGSDGKTTTSTLISELLKTEGYRVWLGGNIGTPLLDRVPEMTPADRAVVELSSFQLLNFPYSPHTAVVTNLAPNHLDMHRDMEEYVAAKKNLILHQTPADRLVLNLDNDLTRAFAADAKAEIVWFSRKTRPARGLWYENGAVRRTEAPEVPLLRREDVLLPGDHNVENYMAAIAAVGDQVSDETVRTVARTFGGVEHRIELVREKDGVRFYNDSIASSPTRTIACLRSFEQKVILIAGGYDKHIPYDVLGPEITAHCKALIVTGATGEMIRAVTEAAPDYRPGSPELISEPDFYAAVRRAAAIAQPGDVVLLSPASAAFDRFKNFMVRGAEFKKTVMEL